MSNTTEFWNKIPLRVSSGKTQTICPECSHTRKKKHERCLSVDVDTGHYHCSHCGVDGWGYVNDFKKPEPVELPKLNTTDLSEKTFKYLTEVRMLSSVTIKRNKITEGLHYMPQVGKERNCIWFNYFVNGEHVNTKFRDGEKNFTQVKNAPKHFYKIDDIAGSDYALIVEGEADALSWEEAGILAAVSVPDGALQPNAKYSAKKLEYIDNDIHFFDHVTKVYLCTDNDPPGLALRKELSRRFGRDRCWIVDLKEYKDANEVLQKLGRVDGVEFLKQAFDNATQYPIEGSLTVDDIFDTVMELYENGMDTGQTVGYEEFDKLIKWLRGWFYLITGIPSHGKSTFFDNILVKLIDRYGWKFAIYSPEHPPEMHIQRLASQLVGKPFNKGFYDRMHLTELNAAMNILRKHIYFIRPTDDDFTLDNILEIGKQHVSRYGIDALIIDPWNTLESNIPNGMNETQHTSKMLDKINRYKQATDCSVIVVAHPTKMQRKEDGTYQVPMGYSISGSANFYNKCDFGMTVYRDFKNNITEAHVWKVKFEGLIGKQGQANFTYQPKDSTYLEISNKTHEQKVDDQWFNDDNSF